MQCQQRCFHFQESGLSRFLSNKSAINEWSSEISFTKHVIIALFYDTQDNKPLTHQTEHI